MYQKASEARGGKRAWLPPTLPRPAPPRRWHCSHAQAASNASLAALGYGYGRGSTGPDPVYQVGPCLPACIYLLCGGRALLLVFVAVPATGVAAVHACDLQPTACLLHPHGSCASWHQASELGMTRVGRQAHIPRSLFVRALLNPPNHARAPPRPDPAPLQKSPYVSKLESIASSAVRAADRVGASLIVVYTHTGKTAQLVAKYRPPMPILTLVVPHLVSDQLKWKLEGRCVCACACVRAYVHSVRVRVGLHVAGAAAARQACLVGRAVAAGIGAGSGEPWGWLAGACVCGREVRVDGPPITRSPDGLNAVRQEPCACLLGTAYWAPVTGVAACLHNR